MRARAGAGVNHGGHVGTWCRVPGTHGAGVPGDVGTHEGPMGKAKKSEAGERKQTPPFQKKIVSATGPAARIRYRTPTL